MEGVVKDDAERGGSGAGTETIVDSGVEAELSRFTMVARWLDSGKSRGGKRIRR